MTGQSKKQIAEVKAELQDFATKTIYSASDMASTYSQLAAVGIKDTTRLVKGFGGLAAAAEDPQQAMKTLSQQATQMAAKPEAQWQDFKLILEQTPAGVAAIAKTMGKSTSQLVKDVQEGKIKTQDFFNAIAETGTNEAFTEMATKFKTVDQAMDGLTEGLTNKLQPAFDKASEYGISFVSTLADKIDGMNFNKLTEWVEQFAPKIEEGLLKGFDWIMDFIPKAAGFISSGFSIAKRSALEFWESLKETGAIDAVKDAFSAIGDAIGTVTDALPKDVPIFEMLGNFTGNGIKAVATMIEDFATSISKLSPDQLKSIGDSIRTLVEVFALFKYGKAALLGSALALIAKGISKLSPSQMEWAAKGIVALVGAFASFKIANGAFKAIDGIKGLFGSKGGLPGSPGGGGPTEQVKGLTEGLNSLAKSAGIALVIGSLAGLALALKPLAELGPSAVAPMITFGLVVGVLGKVLASAGMQLQASAVGILAFSAAVGIMAVSMSLIANAGAYGAQNMIAFGIAVGAMAAIFSIFGAGLNVAIPGMLAFGATMLMVGAALLIATPGLQALPPLVTAIANAFVMAVAVVAGSVIGIVGSVTDLVTQIGDSISQVVETISTGFVDAVTAVSDGISGVVETIGGAISGVLDSIAGIFDSIGEAALNAGTGMERMASGFERISDLGAWDLGKTLGAVAIALGELASHGEGLTVTSTAVMGIATSVTSLAGSSAAAASGMSLLAEYIISASASSVIANGNLVSFASVMAALATITADAAAPMSLLATSLLVIVTAMTQVQTSVETGMDAVVTAFETGMAQSQSTAETGSASIVAAFNGLNGQLYSAGSFAMQGLTSGIQRGAGSAIAAAQSVANRVSATIKKALDIHSPSRVTFEIGAFVSKGLAKGIEKARNLVERASQGLAIAATPSLDQTGFDENGGFDTSVHLDDDELNRLKMASTQTVTIQNKQVTPQVTVHVENNSNEPVDVDALADKVADKIEEAIDSDLG
ncbi:tape measure protein [Enterococcus olivae]